MVWINKLFGDINCSSILFIKSNTLQDSPAHENIKVIMEVFVCALRAICADVDRMAVRMIIKIFIVSVISLKCNYDMLQF